LLLHTHGTTTRRPEVVNKVVVFTVEGVDERPRSDPSNLFRSVKSVPPAVEPFLTMTAERVAIPEFGDEPKFGVVCPHLRPRQCESTLASCRDHYPKVLDSNRHFS
jgi:hypothetical protein